MSPMLGMTLLMLHMRHMLETYNIESITDGIFPMAAGIHFLPLYGGCRSYNKIFKVSDA